MEAIIAIWIGVFGPSIYFPSAYEKMSVFRLASALEDVLTRLQMIYVSRIVIIGTFLPRTFDFLELLFFVVLFCLPCFVFLHHYTNTRWEWRHGCERKRKRERAKKKCTSEKNERGGAELERGRRRRPGLCPDGRLTPNTRRRRRKVSNIPFTLRIVMFIYFSSTKISSTPSTYPLSILSPTWPVLALRLHGSTSILFS